METYSDRIGGFIRRGRERALSPCAHTERGHVRRQGEGGCLPARRKFLTRTNYAGTLIMDFLGFQISEL